MSTITTHILDTSIGKPAEGITVILFRGGNDEWEEIARTKTNA
ncbi:MAG: hydroxyisourate hydrolase, partial [Bacteroidota bacterium]|nr:hydroxyisourate hydrolase [Bacteroidota bacterium]